MLELEPGRIEARFGLALAKEQDGDLDAAEAAYRAMLRKRRRTRPGGAFVDGAARRDRRARAVPDAPTAARRRADAAAADALAGLPEQQRRQIILQMVEGLAARLKPNGRDLDGWQRLVRSWTVLGDTDAAESALGRCAQALAGDAKALDELDAFAREPGAEVMMKSKAVQSPSRIERKGEERRTPMTRKQRRGIMIGGGVVVLAVAGLLVLSALRDTIVFFHTPSDVAGQKVKPGQRFRLGGLVLEGSIKRGGGADVGFASPTRARPSRSPIAACCRTCSAKARAWSRKAARARRGSAPTPFSPSTTRTTCRRRSPRR